MRSKIIVAVLFAAAMPAAGHAQAGPLVTPVRGTYDAAKGYVVRTAAKVPEDLLSFKPTPEVRSFGQILGHIANANFMFCALAKGEKSPQTMDYEKAATKAELIKGLNAAFAYCDGVYGGMSDATAAEAIDVFGQKQTRMYALSLNAAHDFEHYGNLVTYMRLKGIVPPSSEGGA
jgi:uncharacterized damage-inducible protein DinB